MKIIVLIISFYFLQISQIFSQKCYEKDQLSLGKITSEKDRTKFNINRISTFIYNNGDTDISPDGNSGFEYPKGENKAAVFESGLIWGGKIDDQIYVGGSAYSQGLLPGKVFDNGTTQNPNDESVRVYRVRPDYKTSDLSSEIEDENLTYEEIFVKYEKDWNEWPAEFGAPFEDKNNNGIYESSIDIPGIPGAHQTLWYVANDFDTATCRSLYGSDPMKIEFQVTIWGYNIPGTYENVMFKKYRLINKSDKDFTNMFFAQWADQDVGDAGDDRLGVDTLLNLMFAYNGDDYDDDYYQERTPAVGFQILQGPIIESQNCSAFFNGEEINGFKNLKATSFYFYLCAVQPWIDPNIGNYIGGTLRMYNHLQGIHADGSPIEVPIEFGGSTTRFPLSGNPITNEGWVIPIKSCGDVRGVFSSGPFSLKAGEMQEIVIAEFAAQGTDRLNSVALLKYYASKFQEDYPNFEVTPEEPNITQIIPKIMNNEFSQYDLIELNIERDKNIENFSELGFEFQGYNIYQLPNETNDKLISQKIFTYDIIDNITNISGETYNPLIGYPIDGIIQYGNNSGIPSKITIEKDYKDNSPLIKGKTYHYGISAYFYNKDKSEMIETNLYPVSIVFQEDLPGPNFMDSINYTKVEGNSDVEVITEVVNPYELTGNTYEVSFGIQHYYLDENGDWVKTNFPDSVGKNLNKPDDLTGSKLIPLPSIYAKDRTLGINFKLELVNVDNNNADGIRITFPENIKINYGYDRYQYNHNGIISGQTITFGSKDTSGNGYYTGNETFTININFVEPTFSVEYEIFDDGWSTIFAETTGDESYINLGNGIVHAKGTTTLTGEIGYQFKTAKYWDLFDKTKNEFALQKQTIFNGKDTFETKSLEHDYEPIVDGFRIKLNGSFDLPINFSNLDLVSPSGLSSLRSSPSASEEYITITNYTVFGGVVSNWAIDNFNVGTNDINQLIQNYELRFTGVFDKGKNINGQTVYQVASGGQMATIFSMQSKDGLANHPLNPNSGVAGPFLVRIPFEVWNVEDPNNPFQINLTFRDRQRDGTENPFYSWNLSNRMYGIIVNSPYNPNQVIQVDSGSDQYNALATWVLVFYGTNYHLGDVVKVSITNPIEIGDKFSFSTPEPPTEKISPNEFSLFQNYPNPFNPTTKIRYFIPKDGEVEINIYNVLGQKVKELVNENMKAGKYETTFNGSNLSSGVYIYRIEAANFVQSKKMMLLK
ncbi:MAG: T9SS type A sorting domain-containing protein [Melioribacteraceae bacterium]